MKALLLCSSHNDLGLVRSLKKLGYTIVVTGSIPGLPGEKEADKYIQLDYSDKEKVLELAREEKIDAIVQCCNDFGVYTAAYVAEKLGLPGYDSYETTLTLHNKDRFKKFAEENGIVTPKAVRFDDINDAREYIKTLEFPAIVKPTDASAGNGISRVENYEEAYEAVDYAFEKSKSGVIVIEPFINGTQHGFCTFLINKKVVSVCSNNEYSILNPYRVEIDTFPAEVEESVNDYLVEQIEKMAEILDLKDGIFHMQFIMDGNKPRIIEVMRRILGNMYHVPGNMSYGLDLEYWETRVRCGLDVSDFPRNMKQNCFTSYKTILAPSNGVIDRIEIDSRYDKYIFDRFMLLGSGDEITRYKSQPLGFLFMKFDSYEEMKKVLIEEYDSSIVKMSSNKYE